VFMSRHAHDMIATRKRRFLDASIFFLPVLLLGVPSVRTRTFFAISYHDILNTSAKKMFYFLFGKIISLQPIIISCTEIQMNIHKSVVVTREYKKRQEMSQTRQNKIVNALLQMKWTLFQHRNERQRHQSNDIHTKKETLGTKTATSYHTSPFSQTPMQIERDP
jgi:hypothetical protein